MNLPVRSGCFIPSGNTIVSLTLVNVVFLLSETHESIAVLENRLIAAGMVTGSPKPAHARLYRLVTYEKSVPLVLVKVCESVDSAFNHIKKLARSQFLTLGDLGNLHQCLLTKAVKTAVIVALLRWIRHRGDSEGKV